MLTAQGRNGWAQIEHSEGGRAQFVPNTTTNPNQSEPTAANVSVAAKGNPLVTGPPDTSSKLVLRQTLLGRSTSRLRETGHGGGLVPVSVSVTFVRLRSPTLRSDPVMPADREHARTTGSRVAEGSRTRHSSRSSSTAACGEAKRSPSTSPTLILTPSCCGCVAPWPEWTLSSS
jgi:hypothetical protein